jgi:hypothetical protein
MQQDSAGMTTTKRFTAMGLLVLVPMLLLAGCTGSGPKGTAKWKFPWSKKSDVPEPYPNPVRMAVTWAPDTIVQTGRTPTRGFGGRIFFYDEKTHAVPVEGDLTVHAFAEQPDGSVGEVKRYQFTTEQFTKHFSQTDLGASYCIWIPWDAAGGDQMRISLVPTFKSKSGKLVQGETALVGLPGKRSKEEAIAKRFDPTERLRAERANAQSGLTTTTIPIRNGFQPLTPRPTMGNATEMIAGNRQQQHAPAPAMRQQSMQSQTVQSIPMQTLQGQPQFTTQAAGQQPPLPEAFTVGFSQPDPSGAQPIPTTAPADTVRQAGTPPAAFSPTLGMNDTQANQQAHHQTDHASGASKPAMSRISRPQRLGSRISSSSLR